MRGVALNFSPLESHEFKISLYRLPYMEGERPSAGDEEAVCRNLEVEGSRHLYWTLFQPVKNSTETDCEPFDNINVTKDALRLSLIQSCRLRLEPGNFRVTKGFLPRVEIIIANHIEGAQVISLEPYLLRSRGQFGFLADFRFHPTDEHQRTRRALQLSLSLDKNGRRNSNYYADRYSHLVDFVRKFHDVIFPLTLPGGNDVQVSRRLVEMQPEKLETKKYVVGSNRVSSSQFMGVKQSGPLEQCPQDAHLYFLFKEEDRPLSRDLFRALRGNTFNTFSGMERMFHLPITHDSVSGSALADFSDNEIQRVRDRVVADAAGRNVVPIFLTPFSKHDEPEENAAYWKLKHAFLSERIPIQVVASKTVANKEQLKWSAAGIGLQIFAKLGGTPWKVRPRTERCLIVGIGQAHREVNKRIERYFAYSVLTDSSGVFEEVRVLGEDQEEDRYIESFSANLRKIFADYSDRFSSFVVHSTFAIRRNELKRIASALLEKEEQSETGSFVSLKFNDRKGLFGFAVDHNSRVPYESTMLPLARNEFLVWFEGLQYGKSTVRELVGKPLHVEFTYPLEGLNRDQQRAHLQDAINLSGANWRGFNAKSLPVSVYYAQIIAKYLREFERYRLPALDVNILTPWFL
ncbi:MAG: hypothetical protein F4X14_21660 [Caldilineaceae bacterium SB0661_bin_32]|uniref:Protein argonaute n=1 Tax=Caldilineaceae bacterium SB0661_bin_32 TaxID=2605255 RepID=A0A6B1DCR3_9CHLR|nr:hypothetical protein [Caldilineaceae bacterium SB0661_bin_32]